ncbi:MAG: hypothetical protein ACRECO_00095 [Xanthobacteraceae bacterium]
MPNDVAVVFVHGIFGEELSYYEPMQRALLQRLPGLHGYVRFEPVFWAQKVRGHQRKFIQNAGTSIVDNRLRKFLIEGLGDAAAYQKTRRREHSMYYEVHASIDEVLGRIEKTAEDNRPLIFIGHSLGCHIISSYAWDMNKLKQRTREDIQSEPDDDIRSDWKRLQRVSPLRRLDTFAGFVTMGSNMPLFTFTFGPDRVFPITAPPGRDMKPAFPGPGLPEKLLERARWLNFYSKRDLLGFPLKALNDAYRDEKRLRDIPVRTETLTSRTVPYWSHISAHTGYWTNPDVLRETASLIREVIETPR